MLEEKITVLTKSITTLKESLKNDRLMRLMMIKKQCEDISMPLGCMGLENGSHKEKVECVLEEEHMEDSLISLESKSVCIETQHEEVVSDEPEVEVGVEKTQTLEVSVGKGTREEGGTAGVMVCTCEGCVRELHNKELDEMLGLVVGQAVTLGVGVQKWGSSEEDKDDGSHIILCSTTQNLTFYLNHCPIFEVNIMRGKIYDLLTPHFHFNMLVRLMVGLVDMNVVINLLEWKNVVSSLKLQEQDVCYESLFEGDSSWERKIHIFFMEIRTRNCHGYVFKDASMGSPTLRGTVHGVVTVSELNDKITSDSESLQMQDKTIKFIRKWPDFTELDMKKNKEVVVTMHVYDIIGEMNFITKIRVPVAVAGQTFNLKIPGLENNPMNCLLKKSDEDKLNQPLDAQNDSKDVQSAGTEMHFQKFNPPIWKAEVSRLRNNCKDLYPFHYGRINCKMKIFQLSSIKSHIMLLMLSSKPTRQILLDKRGMRLVMLLNWVLKIIEFKVSWVAIINATTLGTKTSSDKTMIDVFEWMIAWEEQPNVGVINKERCYGMTQN